ncbi:FliH/SctL family protein [Megalodesulfovibrio paquesii]
MQYGKVILNDGRALSGGFLEESAERRAVLSAEEEADYMAAVKTRAQEMAAQLLRQAQAEAQALREQAREEGYQEGLEKAREELAEAHAAMVDSLAQALAAVRQGCLEIFAACREDLLLLLRASVEKVLATELAHDRNVVLAAYLDEALERLDGLAGLTVVVHPDDEPLMANILEIARPRYPDLTAWRIRTDEHLAQGSIVVESGQGMVHNTVEARLQAVSRVLEGLTLPATEREELLMQEQQEEEA